MLTRLWTEHATVLIYAKALRLVGDTKGAPKRDHYVGEPNGYSQLRIALML